MTLPKLDDILKQARAVVAENCIDPERLWVDAKTGYELQEWAMREAPPWSPGRRSLFDDLNIGPIGLLIDIDHHLPKDVWRLADKHGTLLYDCRQDKVVP